MEGVVHAVVILQHVIDLHAHIERGKSDLTYFVTWEQADEILGQEINFDGSFLPCYESVSKIFSSEANIASRSTGDFLVVFKHIGGAPSGIGGAL